MKIDGNAPAYPVEVYDDECDRWCRNTGIPIRLAIAAQIIAYGRKNTPEGALGLADELIAAHNATTGEK